MDQRWLTAEPGHGQRIHDKIGRQARVEQPADPLAVEPIQHDGQIQPALVGSQGRDVGGPDRIRRTRRERTIQLILCHRQAVLRVSGDRVAACVTTSDAMLTHEALHPRRADGKTPCTPFPHHPGTPVGSLDLSLDGLEERQQLGIGQPLAVCRASRHGRR